MRRIKGAAISGKRLEYGTFRCAPNFRSFSAGGIDPEGGRWLISLRPLSASISA